MTPLFLIFCLVLAHVSVYAFTFNIRMTSIASGTRSPGDPTKGLSLYAALNEEPLELCEENAVIVIDEVKEELGTIFGYDPKSREVGITGHIEFVECDGPTIRVKLGGRFWHATDTVMMRVESFVRQRIPEVMEVVLDIDLSDIQDDNRLNTGKLY
jgi:hypothetical protein